MEARKKGQKNLNKMKKNAEASKAAERSSAKLFSMIGLGDVAKQSEEEEEYEDEQREIKLRQQNQQMLVPPLSSFKSVPLPRTKSKTELTRKEIVTNECWQKHSEKLEEIKREEEMKGDDAEILDLPLPFRTIGERSSLTNVHVLLEQCPTPQPPIINKHLKTLQLNVDQAYIMAEQVKKMKTGMERLQEIIKKFNCTDRFKRDIDFIIANIKPAIKKAERLRSARSDSLGTKCKKYHVSRTHLY